MPDALPPSASTPPTVLVDLDWQQPGRHDLAERITRTLSALVARVSTTQKELTPDGPVDLVISDRPSALAELGLVTSDAVASDTATSETAGPGPRSDIAAPRVGLIVLGQPAPRADAQLPLDFTERELLLACRLVGEIVMLRRRSRDEKRNSHELARLAAADPLTGLANRRAWDLEAPDRCRRALAGGLAICLAIFDVDRFKAVNDERGYTTGDAVLAAIGRELAAALRTSDLLARLGGDEFAALLIGKFDAAGAQVIVDRVRSAVGRHETARFGFELSLSAGCAVSASGTVAEGGQSADLAALFAAADAALREAKRAGRDRTC